jgi:hypothetical protein
MKASSTQSPKQEVDRLKELAGRSIFLSDGADPTDEENREFLDLVERLHRRGIRFAGVTPGEDDDCPLCIEEKKLAVHDALEPRRGIRRGVQSIRIDLPGGGVRVRS